MFNKMMDNFNRRMPKTLVPSINRSSLMHISNLFDATIDSEKV